MRKPLLSSAGSSASVPSKLTPSVKGSSLVLTVLPVASPAVLPSSPPQNLSKTLFCYSEVRVVVSSHLAKFVFDPATAPPSGIVM